MSEENTIIDVNGEIVKVDNDKKFPPIEDMVKCAPPSPFHPEHGPFPYPPIPNHGPLGEMKKGYVQTIYGDERNIFAERSPENPSEYYVWHSEYYTDIYENSYEYMVSKVETDNGHVTEINYAHVNELPYPSEGDIGKIAVVNEEGEWEAMTLPPIGGSLELHETISGTTMTGTLDRTLGEIIDIIEEQHIIPYFKVGDEVVYISDISGYENVKGISMTSPIANRFLLEEAFSPVDFDEYPERGYYTYYVEVVPDTNYGTVPQEILSGTRVETANIIRQSDILYTVPMPKVGRRNLYAFIPASGYFISKWTVQLPGQSEKVISGQFVGYVTVGDETPLDNTMYRVYIAQDGAD